MAKKNYYYVLVFTNNGPCYVTSIDWQDRYSHWDKDKKPLSMTKTMAQDIVFGLSCNYYNAVLVSTWYELGNQPYNYDDFECVFNKVEKE